MTRAYAVILLAAALLSGGYRWGAFATDNTWKAKEADRLQAEADQREAEIMRGEKASGAYQAELLQQAIAHDQLTEAFNAYKRRHPILARRKVGPQAPAAAAGQAAQPVQCEPVPAGDGPPLSLGAVWMWNSALNQADTPAGACGLADRSEEACAAEAGLTLDDAWDNQALNAKLCAQDRLRHQRLIDFIKGRAK